MPHTIIETKYDWLCKEVPHGSKSIPERFLQPLRRGQPPAVSARQRRISHHDALHREISQARRQSPRDRRRNGPLFSRAGAPGASRGRGGAGRAQHRGFPPKHPSRESVTIAQAMLWICPPLRTTPTMSRFCSARFIICIRRTTSAGRCGRRSASQSRAALSLPLMSSPTAAFWTRASAAAISLLPNMCGTGCWTPGRLPPAPSQRICSSWCAKRMLMS